MHTLKFEFWGHNKASGSDNEKRECITQGFSIYILCTVNCQLKVHQEDIESTFLIFRGRSHMKLIIIVHEACYENMDGKGGPSLVFCLNWALFSLVYPNQYWGTKRLATRVCLSQHFPGWIFMRFPADPLVPLEKGTPSEGHRVFTLRLSKAHLFHLVKSGRILSGGRIKKWPRLADLQPPRTICSIL